MNKILSLLRDKLPPVPGSPIVQHTTFNLCLLIPTSQFWEYKLWTSVPACVLLKTTVKSYLSSTGHIMTMLPGADPGFFLGGFALVSCSTSTPINHIVFFFFFAEYQLY